MFKDRKKTILFLNIFLNPILTVIFFSQTTTLVPNFVFEINNGWTEFMFRIASISIPINILYCATIIFNKKEKLKWALIYGLIGVALSLTAGVFVMFGLETIFYTSFYHV